jgi:uncharacterized protein (UPF0248 family)
MWDPSLNSSDYVIGYEDRFKGVKETPLGTWKREVEDEAFVSTILNTMIMAVVLTDTQIPFHRVVYFRRKSDNVLVWDRWVFSQVNPPTDLTLILLITGKRGQTWSSEVVRSIDTTL